MKLEELNEFLFFNKRKTPSDKKIKYSIRHHTAYFELEGYTRFSISHKSIREGGGYDVRLSGASQVFSDVAININDAIKDMIGIVTEWKKKANRKKLPDGKIGTETSPADLIQLTLEMFDENKLKKELSYRNK